MKQALSALALLILIVSPVIMRTSAVAQSNPHRAMVGTYCVTCHNTQTKSGGLALDGEVLNRLAQAGGPAGAAGQAVAADAPVWEKALRKLRGHQMPPPGAPQPPQADVDAFVA